jgi:hypothetical protein
MLRSAITAAVAPLKDELAAAVATDRKLYAELEDVLPGRIKTAWDELFHRACSGDPEAVSEIEAAGGAEAWQSRRGALLPLRESYRSSAAKGTVQLLERLSDSLLENLERTRTAIEEQWRAIQAYHGEMPGLSIWDERIRNLKNGLSHMPAAAVHGTGIRWQLEQLGLIQFLID